MPEPVSYIACMDSLITLYLDSRPRPTGHTQNTDLHADSHADGRSRTHRGEDVLNSGTRTGLMVPKNPADQLTTRQGQT